MVCLASSFLNREDGKGFKVREWGEVSRESKHKLLCKVCNCVINVSKGFQAIEKHVSSEKHVMAIVACNSSNQSHLKVVPILPGDTALPGPSGGLQIYTVGDRTVQAELIWCLKMVQSNFSASSCSDLNSTFQAMFGGNDIVDKFALGKTKASYLVSEALSPYFKDLQKDDMKGARFALCYDETTNHAHKKELQCSVRYWSNGADRVVFEHLETFFIGRATADIVVEKLNDAMKHSNLPDEDLLMLGHDGPNVNKAVFSKINSKMLQSRNFPLIDIGSCNIHVAHNAFLKALEQLGEDCADLLVFLHGYFEDFPSRWEEFGEVLCYEKFKKLELEPLRFLKHVPSRWLTVKPAADRALYHWQPLQEYFFKYLTSEEKKKKNPKLLDSNSYKKVTDLLKKSTMKAELMFVSSSAKLFIDLNETLQREEPLVHLLYPLLKNLTDTLIGRSCKDKTLPYALIFEPPNLLLPEKVEIDEELKKELSTVKNELARMKFLERAQKHYIKAAKHIIEKSSMETSSLLKNLQCLHPSERTKSISLERITRAAKALPWCVDTAVLRDEWRLMQLEKSPDGSSLMRIDTYWAHFFQIKNALGQPKYPTLTKVVKALLALSHGNADVERKFSDSGNTLTPDRSRMIEKTLNANQNVKSLLRRHNNLPYAVPISKKLLTMARGARAKYEIYLEEEKKKKEKEEEDRLEKEAGKQAEEDLRRKMQEEQKTLKNEEEQLKSLKKKEEEQKKRADTLFVESTTRLEKAVASGNLTEAALAQAMLKGVQDLRQDANKTSQDVKSAQRRVDKRKADLLNAYAKKSKPSK